MVIKSHRVQIYPNKTQRNLIKRILRACNVVHREVTRLAFEEYDYQYKYAETHNMNTPRDIPSTCRFLLNSVLESAEFAGLFSGISKHTLYRSAEIAYEAFTDYIFKHGESYKLYSNERHTSSFYMDPPRSVKWIRKKHVKIPMLKKLAAANTSYLEGHALDNLVGMTIKKVKDEYFMTVRIREPGLSISEGIQNNFNLFSNGITIDLSTGPRFAYYIMAADGFVNTIDDFTSDPRIKNYEYKIHLIQSYVNNLKLIHQSSEKITHLENRIRHYRECIKGIKMNHIDKIVYKLVKDSPDYIFTTSFCAQYFRNSEPHNYDLFWLTHDRMWDYFFYRLKSSAKFHGADLLVPVNVNEAVIRCANCGRYNALTPFSDVEYRCMHCGKGVIKSRNVVMNLGDPYTKETYSLLHDNMTKKRYILPNIKSDNSSTAN